MLHAIIHIALEIVVVILVLNAMLVIALAVAAVFWFKKHAERK